MKNVISSLRAHPRYVFMRTIARFKSVRQIVILFTIFSKRPIFKQHLHENKDRLDKTVFSEVDVEKFSSALTTNGISFGLKIPENMLAELLDFAYTNSCYADREKKYGFHLNNYQRAKEVLGKEILIAQYFNTRKCASVEKLVYDPVIQLIAAIYLQSVPIFVGANMWWTFPVDASKEDRFRHAHLFHRDVDDYRFIKFFFYLTDVEKGEGAHVCVLGSHSTEPKIKALDPWILRRYSDKEIYDFYEKKNILEICGPAGSGFAENTLCVHKGCTPKTKARLILQFQYALHDYGGMNDDVDDSQLSLIA